MSDTSQLIKDFNSGRHPELLMLKYQRMAQSRLSFFRGTCHLFYHEIQHIDWLYQCPITWLCGDLHLENFGSHKGDNRLVYFDLNDFDEALIGPALWDITRLLTNIILTAESFGWKKNDSKALCQHFLHIYSDTLKSGNPKLLERDLSVGIIRSLLKKLTLRKRKDILKGRVVKRKQQIKLDVSGIKALPIDKEKKSNLTKLVNKWLEKKHGSSGGEVLDVAQRIAGTGSLGIERYIILAESSYQGKRDLLLDLKLASPSAPAQCIKTPQPLWKNEAHRIIEIQKRMQAVPPAFLDEIVFEKKHFTLKELQPSEDKINIFELKNKSGEINSVLDNYARLLAWSQLRSGGRQGSAITDELIGFSNEKAWQKNSIEFAFEMNETVKKDYQSYLNSYQDGFFKIIGF